MSHPTTYRLNEISQLTSHEGAVVHCINGGYDILIHFVIIRDT